MHLLWTYLRPQRALVALALLLAAIAQVLALVDPIIFGRIVDGYAMHPGGRSRDELVARSPAPCARFRRAAPRSRS